jgi:hypothetical protein
MHPYVKDLTGQTFGRLLVVGPVPRPEGSKGRGQYWECVCECLSGLVVRSDSLVQGWSKSCGCANPEVTAMLARNGRVKHRAICPQSTVSEQP